VSPLSPLEIDRLAEEIAADVRARREAKDVIDVIACDILPKLAAEPALFKGRRVASHRRRHGRGEYATDPAHMPHAHRAHAECVFRPS
jgi:hypothetical protein